MAFLDSDDWWSRDYLARQIAILDQGYDASYGTALKVRNGRTKVGTQPGPTGDITEAILAGWSVSTTSCLVVRRDAAVEVRFDEALTGLQDFDFLLRLSQGRRVGCAPRAVVYFAQHEQARLTTNPEKRMRGITGVRSKHSALAAEHGLGTDFDAFLNREYARAAAELYARVQVSFPRRLRLASDLFLRGAADETGRPIPFDLRACMKVLLGADYLDRARKLLWAAPFTSSSDRPPDEPGGRRTPSAQG